MEGTKVTGKENQDSLTKRMRFAGQPLPATGQADPESRSTDGSRQELWLTPKVPSGGGQAERTTAGGGLRKLEDQTEGRQNGKLNPHWVFTLMGYPPLWAEIGHKFTTESRNSKRPATQSYQK
jgi:hypothetical protein